MENQHHREPAQNADPQDPQNETKNNALHADQMQYSGASSDHIARTTEEVDKIMYASPDEDEDEEEETDDDDALKDWGHTDPAEGNSPFPDPMEPSGPGSAV